MYDLVEQIKAIYGFRLGFPSWVNLNLNRVMLNIKISEELDIGIHLVGQLGPRTHNDIYNVSITTGHC